MDNVAPSILIIDDDHKILDLVRDLFESQQFIVFTADNGIGGLQIASEKRPDLIILDMMMEGMDGLEVCKSLKKDRDLNSIPIIFVTGIDDTREKVEAFTLGGVDYLVKPVVMKELLVRVRTHIKNAQLQRELHFKNITLHNEIEKRKKVQEELQETNKELDLRVQERTKNLEFLLRDIKAKEQRFHVVVESMDELVYTLTFEGEFREIYGNWYDKFGLLPKKLLGKKFEESFSENISLIHEPQHKKAFFGKKCRFEWSYTGKSGTVHLQTSLSPIYYSTERVDSIVGTIRDITRQKKIDLAREFSLQLQHISDTTSLDDLVETALEECLSITDSRDGFFHSLDMGEKYKGKTIWSKRTQCVCNVPLDDYHKPEVERGIWADCIATRGPVIHNEYSRDNDHNQFPEGHLEMTRDLEIPIIEQKKVVAILGVANKPVFYDETDVHSLQLLAEQLWNILQKKSIEMRLRERESYYRSLIDNLHEEILVINKDHKIIDGNRLLFESAQMDKKDIVGKKCYEVLHNLRSPCDENGIECHYRTVIETGKPALQEHSHILPNGKKAYSDILLSPICTNGRVEFIIEAMRDVSELKTAESRTVESEKRFRSLFEVATEFIHILDCDGRIQLVNPTTRLRLGFNESELKGKLLEELYTKHSQPLFNQAFRELLEGKSLHREFELMGGDGKTIFVDSVGSVVRDDRGKISFIVIFQRDITKQHESELQIRQSLQEKEVLLREIHHRVKNNLQVISSLLRIQSRVVKDKTAFDYLMHSQSRVRAISLIHENLYQSENLSQIELNEYIPKLIDSISRFYSIDPGKISVKQQIEKISIDIKYAIPIGLVINELLTNAFKHAFEHQTKDCFVEITLDKKSGQLHLSVADNGIGMQDKLKELKLDTMGLSLTQNLIEKQLKGSIHLVEQNVGTNWQMTFPLESDE